MTINSGPIRVISIDPGIHTGYCYAEITTTGQLNYYPFEALDEVDDMWRRLIGFKPRYIVIEDFEFRRGKSATGGLELFSMQLIGVARLYMLVKGQCAIYIQSANVGLGGFYSDRTLKQMGLYVKVLEHGMSASKHLLQWATFGAGNQFISGDITKFMRRLDSWDEYSERRNE